MDNTNRPMSCHKALKIVHGLFYGGLGLLLVAWAVLSLSQETVPVLVGVLCVLGIVGIVSGIVMAVARLRCPYCGASLMLGGRIPSHLPNYCPDCGRALE